jgi:hypothetical protein
MRRNSGSTAIEPEPDMAGSGVGAGGQVVSISAVQRGLWQTTVAFSFGANMAYAPQRGQHSAGRSRAAQSGVRQRRADSPYRLQTPWQKKHSAK